MAEEVTVDSARAFVSQALEGFVYDPADSEFQKGYLEALYQIGRHGLGMDLGKEPEHKSVQTGAVPFLRVVK